MLKQLPLIPLPTHINIEATTMFDLHSCYGKQNSRGAAAIITDDILDAVNRRAEWLDRVTTPSYTFRLI